MARDQICYLKITCQIDPSLLSILSQVGTCSTWSEVISRDRLDPDTKSSINLKRQILPPNWRCIDPIFGKINDILNREEVVGITWSTDPLPMPTHLHKLKITWKYPFIEISVKMFRKIFPTFVPNRYLTCKVLHIVFTVHFVPQPVFVHPAPRNHERNSNIKPKSLWPILLKEITKRKYLTQS